MIELKHITKKYESKESSVTALDDISISFRKNEFVAILGPSGCGKTTMLNILGGLDKYTSGDLVIDGRSTKDFSMRDWDTYRNREIGFVFQSYNLIPHLSIRRNVELALKIGGYSKEECKSRAIEALEKVGLGKLVRKKPNQLSGGQMQRVAIARAIVNNPTIILADEPTGALDSESGLQVMNLLANIAKDHLVIMVTHNDDLAIQYATRVVKIKDGIVLEDSMPYDDFEEEDVLESNFLKDNSSETPSSNQKVEDETVVASETAGLNETVVASETVIANETVDSSKKFVASETANTEEKVNIEALADSDNLGEKTSDPKTTKLLAKEKRKQKREEKRNAKNVSMKLSTAVSLSARNLISKKTRTFLTSFASSIGIIGIALILALSTGVNIYIKNTEESALATYPLQISEKNADVQVLIDILQQANTEVRPDYPNSEDIFINKIMGNLAPYLDTLFKPNDMKEIKTYLDKNFNDDFGIVEYDYAAPLTMYCDVTKTNKYVKINPFLDDIKDVIGDMGDLTAQIENMMQMFSVWDEIPDNRDLLTKQYDLVGNNSRWPRNANEIVVKIDKSNQIDDYTLFCLGLVEGDNALDAIFGNGDFYNKDYSADDLLNLEYKVMANSDYFYQKNGGSWAKHSVDMTKDAGYINENSETMKVVGVVRPKQNINATLIKGVIGYTSDFTRKMIARTNSHPLIVAQKQNTDINIFTGNAFSTSEEDENTYAKCLASYGVADLTNPKTIKIYANSCADKDKILALLSGYEKISTTKQSIKYSDTLAVLMNYVGTLTDMMTRALFAFSSISLIVSSIMIGIITYTSVLERRKEIGVLRSIGGRKSDIYNVFLSESSIIGLISGVLAIAFSYFAMFIANIILQKQIGIVGLLQFYWWHPVVLIGISLGLSFIAGLIPSAIAANKDPVVALRSE